MIFYSGTGCIILSPTRELALQTCAVLKKLLVDTDLSHALIVGGEKKLKDIKSLSGGKTKIIKVFSDLVIIFVTLLHDIRQCNISHNDSVLLCMNRALFLVLC